MTKPSPPLSVGDIVWVKNNDDNDKIHPLEESGVVIALQCEYFDEEVDKVRSDGVLVKLKVSNTRGTFAPSNIRLFDNNADESDSKNDNDKRGGRRRSARRTQQTTPTTTPPKTAAAAVAANTKGSSASVSSKSRMHVTPSPTLTMEDDDDDEGESKQVIQSNKKRQNNKSNPVAMDVSDNDNDSEGASTGKSGNNDNDNDNDEPLLFVEYSKTASSKCPKCESKIAKCDIRVRPNVKGRWWHMRCVDHCLEQKKITIEKLSDISGITSLSSSHQKEVERYCFGKKFATAVADGDGDHDDNASQNNTANDESDDNDDIPLDTLMKKKPAAKKTSSSSSSSSNITSSKATVSKKKVDLIMASDSENDNDNDNNQGGDNVNNNGSSDDGSGSSDDENHPNYRSPPFRAEYATTGRSTCKGCDERIAKGILRIAHRPLFRGKPGFTVYRHLHCTVFSEEIKSMQDIGGWRRLKKPDQHLLQERVIESEDLIRQENEELEPDELVQVTYQGEIRKSPPGLSASLLPFQVEGASWMCCQEINVDDIHGGILADEMGMGKTIQTITTILDNRPKLQHANPNVKLPPNSPDLEALTRENRLWQESKKSWDHEMEMANVPKKLLPKATKTKSGGAARAGTLVVCPVIALLQWKSEIEKFTEPNSLTICIYHGPNRAAEHPREMLRKYDIVLTTYQVLEADFRKMVSPNKVKCPNCGGAFKIDKLRVHLKYFCGEGARRTEAQARQRRTADRRSPNQRFQSDSDDSDSDSESDNKKRKSKSSKKAPMTKKNPKGKKMITPSPKNKKEMNHTKKANTKSPPKTKAASKTAKLRIRRSAGYDSDSELSIPHDTVQMTNSKRPSRSAAASASKKMTASKKEWADEAGGESDYDQPSDETSSSDESSVGFRTSKRKATKVTKTTSKDASSDDSGSGTGSDGSDNNDDSESDTALKHAAKKQRLAMNRAKASKKDTQKKGKTKKFEKKKFDDKEKSSKKKLNVNKKRTKKKQKAVMKKKATGKQKHPDYSSSSGNDSSDSESSESSDDDPMKGIDMQKLIEEAMAGSRVSVLHTFCWWRVVLDEAHMIKSRASQTSASAFALTSIHRWCLSGTPLQNRVGELYSLIRFLRIDPMAHYFCRKDGCGCKSIHYRMKNGKCQDCGHGSIQHYSHFNKHVLNPIQRDGYQGDGRRAMMKLKAEVLDKSLLRRTKQNRAEDMNLPPRVVTIRTIRLHPIEEDFYNALYTQTKSSFDDYIAEGTLLNNYAHIFDLLTKMRQAVDHPYLIVYSKKNAAKQALSGNTPLVANGTVDCDICDEPPTDRVVSSCCGAAFCRSCVLEYMSPTLEGSGGADTRCPSCRAPFSIDLSQASSDVIDEGTLSLKASNSQSNNNSREGMPSLKEMSHVATGSILRRINLEEFATSTKIEALIQELVQMRRERPGSKALVFSQFVNMLDLVRWRLHSDPCLQDLGIGVRIIHGGMNVKSRDESLKAFKEDASVRVLLMSLKAGGVALNLTVANEAYLLDPWWNPAAEMQAIDRTHRLGQFRPIRAVRFIAEGTVEERVLQLQEKKRLVFDGTVGRDAASLKMLTVDDMKALFA